MSTAVAIYDRVTDTLAFTERLGQAFHHSGMFGCKTPSQGQVLALACASERLSPIAIKRRYHLIDGELSMRADAMLAEFRQRGGKHEILSRTADRAEIRLTLDGQTHVESLTWDEAKAEPFVYQKDGKSLKKNWATPRARKQMMWARVVSDGVRAICPEVCAGAYTPEELDHDPTASESNGKSGSPTAAEVDAMLKDAAAHVGCDGMVAFDLKLTAPANAAIDETPKVNQPAAVASESVPPCETGTTTPAGIAANDKNVVRPADSMPCTAEMRDKIELYFDQLGMTPEQRDAALRKRGVASVRSLTINQALELIAKLRELQKITKKSKLFVLQDKIAEAASKAVDEKLDATLAAAKPAESPPAEMQSERSAADTEPCSPDQVTRIKTLIVDLADQAIATRIKSKLADSGLAKLADLSIRDALELESCLAMKSIEAWAARTLDGKVESSPDADAKN